MFLNGMFVGLFFGCCIGIFVMCAMFVAKQADEATEPKIRDINGNPSIGGCRLVTPEIGALADEPGEKSNAV